MAAANGQDDGQDAKEPGRAVAAVTRVFYGLFYLRIDAVFLYVAVQGVDQVVHRAGRHIVARLMGGGADMRQRDDVRQAQQR